jgi:hypothetical protein
LIQLSGSGNVNLSLVGLQGQKARRYLKDYIVDVAIRRFVAMTTASRVPRLQ